MDNENTLLFPHPRAGNDTMAEGCTSAGRHDAMMEPARRLVSVNLACAWCSRRLQLHDADLLNRDGDVACPGCHRSIFCWSR